MLKLTILLIVVALYFGTKLGIVITQSSLSPFSGEAWTQAVNLVQLDTLRVMSEIQSLAPGEGGTRKATPTPPSPSGPPGVTPAPTLTP